MLNKFKVFLILICCFSLTGCAAVIIGAGAGAGAFAYIDGNLKRTYQARFDKTLQVCLGILKDLSLPILEKKSDGAETTIRTERADKTPMTIKIAIVSADWTNVSVRTGTFGLWKKDISKQFHEFIQERLTK